MSSLADSAAAVQPQQAAASSEEVAPVFIDAQKVADATNEVAERMPGAPRYAQLRQAAFSLASQGCYPEAAEVYAHAMAEYETVAGETQPAAAAAADKAGNTAAAAAAAAAAGTVVEDDAPLPQHASEHTAVYQDFVPFCLNELGILHARNGALADAVACFESALAHLHAAMTAADADGNCFRFRRSRCLLVETKKHLATALKSGGELSAAGALFCELIGHFRAGQYQSPLLYSDCCFHLAEILNSQGQFAAAEPVVRECVRFRRRLFGGACPIEAAAISRALAPAGAAEPAPVSALAVARDMAAAAASGRTAELAAAAAEPTAPACDAACDAEDDGSCAPASEVAVALCLMALTIAAPGIGKYAEAEACVREAIEIVKTCGAEEEACTSSTSTSTSVSGTTTDASTSGMEGILASIRAARRAAEDAEEAAEAAEADAAAEAGDLEDDPPSDADDADADAAQQ